MKGLGKENYASLRFLLMMMFTVIFISTSSNCWSQFCDIRVASEPLQKSIAAIPRAEIQSTNTAAGVKWTSNSSAIAKDTKIEFSRVGVSQVIKFSDFKFRIPLGATIQGYKVNFTGKSVGMGSVYDHRVVISVDNAASNNMAGKGYNSKSVFIKSNASRNWSYGGKDDIWGLDLSSEQINNKDFGIEIQIANSTNKFISAFIEGVSLEVFYTEAPTFCTTDCFPVYTKTDHPSRPFYKWTIPQGFEMISRSDRHYIVDFKAPNAKPGLYKIKVEALDAAGKVLQVCERNIRIRKCDPAIIGDRVWNDLNFNGLQDTLEPGLANIKINLLNDKNVLVKSATTDANGKYQFTGITEGGYKFELDLGTSFVSTKNNQDEIRNSDLIFGKNTSNSFDISFNDTINNIDFGLIKKLTVGDFVWIDSNCNNLQDAGESGVSGVKVFLRDEANLVVDSTITDARGKYSLRGLALKYKLQFEIPKDHIAINSISSNKALNSDIDSLGMTQLLDFTNISIDTTIDAGFVKLGSIGDFVWNDLNNDGIQNTNEAGTAGIKIDLIDDKNTVIRSTVSDAIGKYIFNNIVPAKYKVRAVIPTGAILAKSTTNQNGSSLATLENGLASTDFFNIKSGQNKLDVDLGYAFALGKISGRMWYDANVDGLYSQGEELISELLVSLLDNNKKIIYTTVTKGDGSYCFDSLNIGDYQVSFDIDDDIQFSKPNAGDDKLDSDVTEKILKGFSPLLSIKGGRDSIANIDAGVVRRSIIGDFVWLDENLNGLQDENEKGIKNVFVQLCNDKGELLDTTSTDENGEYLFQKIPAGSYNVKVSKPKGFEFTIINTSNDSLNNDFDTLGRRSVFTVALGDDNINVDAGFIPLIEIGDFVFEDLDADGIYQDTDLPLSDIEVILLDEKNNEVQKQRTDINGKYSFKNIKAGKYQVVINIRDNYFVSPLGLDNVGDSNGKSQLKTYLASNDSIDFALFKKSCIKGTAWVDVNENGRRDAEDTVLAATTIILKGLNVNDTIITDSDGNYSFCDLIPGKYTLQFVPGLDYILAQKSEDNPVNNLDGIFISNTINTLSNKGETNVNVLFIFKPTFRICGKAWIDKNANGLVEPTEMPLADIVINLFDENNNFIKSVTTNPNGLYCFEVKEKKNYLLKTAIDDSLQITDFNIGSNKSINNVFFIKEDSLFTELIPFDIKNIKLYNLGVTFKSKIGDQAWIDVNTNGLLDENEPGFSSFMIELLDQDKKVVKTTKTNADGKYLFSKVARGKYFVKFNFANGEKQSFTLKNISPTKGSDVDSTGITDTILVNPNDDNFDIDAGIITKGSIIEGTVAIDLRKDTIVTDEDRLFKLRVQLFNDKDELIESVVSDENGNYKFNDLPIGNYYVKFDSLQFYSIYTKGQAKNSDITNERGRGTTSIFKINGGELIRTNALFHDIRSNIVGKLFYNEEGKDSLTIETKFLADKKVYLLDGRKLIIDSTFTDAKGMYYFFRVPEGLHFIQYPNISEDTVQIAQTLLSDTVSTGICQLIKLNYGYTGFGKISGSVFVDVNDNGLNDDNRGLNGVLLRLLDLNDNIIDQDTSFSTFNDFGIYNFPKVKAGQYKMSVIKPISYVFAKEDVLNNTQDNIDSDFKQIASLEGRSEVFSIRSGDEKPSLDAGFVFSSATNSSIAGLAWTEASIDGIRQSNEKLRQGIVITLTNEVGAEISKTTTDDKGQFIFNNLAEGFYILKAKIDEEETATLYNATNDSLVDNDFNNITEFENATEVIYLPATTNLSNIDLGIAEEASIGNFVWNDTNLDGIQDPNEPGIQDVEIGVYTASGMLVKRGFSNERGAYLNTDIPVGSYIIKFSILNGYSVTKQAATSNDRDSDINEKGETVLIKLDRGFNGLIDGGFIRNANIGDRVWIDFNANGIQDANEPGKDGIDVSLFTENNTLVATSFTKPNPEGLAGYYNFINIKPGKYYVKFSLPANAIVSPQNKGDEKIDSDIDKEGKSDVFTLLSDVDNNDADAGYYLPACIGDRVWSDTNKNGIQDAGEPGIKDVVVKLFSSFGSLISTQTTNQNGEYLFNNLPQGLFSLELTVPQGLKLTVLDQGDDDAKDSDFTLSGNTPLISLAHAAKFYDLDAGLIPATNLIEVNNEKASLVVVELDKPKALPNPALYEVQIEVPFEECILSIYNMNGALIYQDKNYKNLKTISIDGYKGGIYNIVASNAGRSVSSKFIKAE